MDAEDLAQQAVIRAHDRLAAFRGESQFTTWLYRIAYNQAIDHTRRATRRRRLIRDAPMPAGPEPVALPDATTLADERSRVVHRALNQVPQPYRAALRLYYWFDQPVREIAESLGVGQETAKSYLHRGRQRLRRLVEETEVRP
jgi:RNA polymerase sigma-70 factor (ECF subfamily)